MTPARVLRDETDETVDLRTQRCPCCGTRPAPSEAELMSVEELADSLDYRIEQRAHQDYAKHEKGELGDTEKCEAINVRRRREITVAALRSLIELARARGAS